MPNIPLLTYLGNGSYSIYLWHALAISVIAKFAASYDLPPDAAVMLSVIFGTLLGILAYEGVEKPLRILFKSQVFRRIRLSPV